MKGIYNQENDTKLKNEIVSQLNVNPIVFIKGLPNCGRSNWMRKTIYEDGLLVKDYIRVIFDMAADKALEDWVKESVDVETRINNFEKWVEESVEMGKKMLFVINSLDSIMLREKRFLDGKRIMNMYFRYTDAIKLIIGQGVEEVEEAKNFLGTLTGYLNTSVVWLPMISKDEACELGLPDELYQITGGYLPLVKRAIRVGTAGVEDELVDYNLELLWNGLSSESQKELKLYVLGKNKDFGEYLNKTGVVRESKLFSPLFESWIRKMMAKSGVSLEEKEGKLCLKEGIDVETLLSFQEYEILKRLWQSKSQVVTRNEVAEVLWGSKTEENYSDWAIDQVVSKLRRKIGDIGEKRLVETVKGKGFKVSL